MILSSNPLHHAIMGNKCRISYSQPSPDMLPQISGMKLMQFLRVVSLSEGVSFLLLLGVAMPLKYAWDMPSAVTLVGSAHGILFLALGFLLLLLAMARAALPFKTAIIVGMASLLPAGPFFADRLLKRHLDSNKRNSNQ